MKGFLFGISLLSLLVLTATAQTKRAVTKTTAAKSTATAPKTPAGIPAALDHGTIVGHTYTNKTFGFELTFPDAWIIPDDEYAKTHGLDLGLRPPVSADPKSQKIVDSAFSRITLLFSVYKYLPELRDNSEVRVAAEDLGTQPQIKDAVDYVDALRQIYTNSNLPAGVQYSETKAERLGSHQFAYIDLATPDGKTRMYVTVRNRFAILFKLSYADDKDLETFRDVLAKGNFSLK
jgi:hypothetical protein